MIMLWHDYDYVVRHKLGKIWSSRVKYGASQSQPECLLNKAQSSETSGSLVERKLQGIQNHVQYLSFNLQVFIRENLTNTFYLQ